MITAEEFQDFVPGELIFDRSARGWREVTLKGFRYTGLEVTIPPLESYLIVLYDRISKGGTAQVERRYGGPWQTGMVEKGSLTVHNCGEEAEWRWKYPLEVTHLYLDPAAVKRVAEDVFDKTVESLNIEGCIRSYNPSITRSLILFQTELRNQGFGEHLYIDALKNQVIVDILRGHADLVFRKESSSGSLTVAERKRLIEFITTNIHQSLQLTELAACVNLNMYSFVRRFKSTFGCTPHSYVMQRRLACAKDLLSSRSVPLKVVAASSGYSDQSHMTRAFQRAMNCTPKELRRSLRPLP